MKRTREKTTPGRSSPSRDGFFRKAYVRFVKMRGEPREIARGLAIGIMVGMTPFLGFHTIAAVFVAAIWKSSKIAAAVGVFVTNPLTAPLIYPVTYMVGKAICGFSNIPNPQKVLSLEAAIAWIKHSPALLVDLTVGGIVLGLPLSLAAYWIALASIENYRKKIKPKLKKRRRR